MEMRRQTVHEHQSLLEIGPDTLRQWQDIVDILAAALDLPAALVMRMVGDEIEVFVTSSSPGNPYKKGDHEHLCGSGLYCEHVIESQKPLLVPDARADPDWEENPDIAVDMISYLGYPLSYPDGTHFGTICVLDNKKNEYSDTARKLLERFRDVIEGNLALCFLNRELGEENRSLKDLLETIRRLKGMHPICSYCKKVRDEQGRWTEVSAFITKRSEAVFTHSVCKECMAEHHPDVEQA